MVVRCIELHSLLSGWSRNATQWSSGLTVRPPRSLPPILEKPDNIVPADARYYGSIFQNSRPFTSSMMDIPCKTSILTLLVPKLYVLGLCSSREKLWCNGPSVIWLSKCLWWPRSLSRWICVPTLVVVDCKNLGISWLNGWRLLDQHTSFLGLENRKMQIQPRMSRVVLLNVFDCWDF